MTPADILQSIQTEATKAAVALVVIPVATWSFVTLRGAIIKIAAVHKAIMPNGGSSLWDDIGKIKNHLTVLQTGLRFHSQRRNDCPASPYVYEFDSEGMCVWASPNLADLFGIQQSEMLGLGWLGGIDSMEKRESAQEHWQMSRERGIPYEDTFQLRNGKIVTTKAYPAIRDGKVLHYFGEVRVATFTPTKVDSDVAEILDRRSKHQPNHGKISPES